MEAKEKKSKNILPWLCIQERSVHASFNSVCAQSKEPGKQSFKIIYTENDQEQFEINALQQSGKEKVSQLVEDCVPTAFAQHACGFAYGYNNGKIKISDTSMTIQDGKTHDVTLQAFSAKQSIIAAQFSPDAWYLATLTSGTFKLWERQYSTNSCLEKKKIAIPTIILGNIHKKGKKRCAIL